MACLCSACYPTLDWREVQPEGTELRLLFPCKPKQQTGAVRLAGATVDLTLAACSAGGATYAIGHADMVDPARVTAALSELADSAARNLGAPAAPGVPWHMPGMTPNERSERLALRGKLPDGTAVDEQLVVFARGTRIYQATVLGKSVDREAADTFFASLRLPA